MRVVQCVVLNQEAEGLEKAPYPGDLGVRIFENVSQEGWKKWLDQLTMIINENGLSTADPRSVKVVEDYMVGYFFKEGDYSGIRDFQPRPRK